MGIDEPSQWKFVCNFYFYFFLYSAYFYNRQEILFKKRNVANNLNSFFKNDELIKK